jgi:hypothetical protein
MMDETFDYRIKYDWTHGKRSGRVTEDWTTSKPIVTANDLRELEREIAIVHSRDLVEIRSICPILNHEIESWTAY